MATLKMKPRDAEGFIANGMQERKVRGNDLKVPSAQEKAPYLSVLSSQTSEEPEGS